MKLGLTLPSFRDGPEAAFAVARAAESAGLDAVFAFDHLYRLSREGERRPALELLTMLGALAVETDRIAVGSLVARATLRPAASLAAGLDTVARIAGSDRLLATIGAGDHESRLENESFGLRFGTMQDRLRALEAAVVATRDHGYPVWVGGTSTAVRALAARHADGWNFWGGDFGRFARFATEVRAAAVRPGFVVSWGGLVVLDESDAAAAKKAERLGHAPGTIVGGPDTVARELRARAAAGAELLVLGPVDSANVDNAALVGELVAPLLAG